MLRSLPFLTILFLFVSILPAQATRPVRLATTTSVENSGLLDELLQVYPNKAESRIQVLAVGSGKALRMGADGECDLLFVHDPEGEEEAKREGWVSRHLPLMENEFLLVGPSEDPAAVRNGASQDIRAAFSRIAAAKQLFISRGDDSGTHRREQQIWQEAKIRAAGDWYLSAGRGMADTLRIADEKRAYTLTDRATLLALSDTLDLAVHCQNDPRLLNRYSLLVVLQHKERPVNQEGADLLADWLLTAEAARRIAAFGYKKHGVSLFRPLLTPENTTEIENENPQ